MVYNAFRTGILWAIKAASVFTIVCIVIAGLSYSIEFLFHFLKTNVSDDSNIIFLTGMGIIITFVCFVAGVSYSIIFDKNNRY